MGPHPPAVMISPLPARAATFEPVPASARTPRPPKNPASSAISTSPTSSSGPGTCRAKPSRSQSVTSGTVLPEVPTHVRATLLMDMPVVCSSSASASLRLRPAEFAILLGEHEFGFCSAGIDGQVIGHPFLLLELGFSVAQHPWSPCRAANAASGWLKSLLQPHLGEEGAAQRRAAMQADLNGGVGMAGDRRGFVWRDFKRKTTVTVAFSSRGQGGFSLLKNPHG